MIVYFFRHVWLFIQTCMSVYTDMYGCLYRHVWLLISVSQIFRQGPVQKKEDIFPPVNYLPIICVLEYTLLKLSVNFYAKWSNTV